MSKKRVATTWKVNPNANFDKQDLDTINKDNLANFIISLKEPDITYDMFMRLFGTFAGKTLCNPYDLLVVPPNSFYFEDEKGKERSNTNEFTTTIGIYIFNLMLSGFGFSKLIDGYYANKNINKKEYSVISQTLAYALIEDDITTDQIKKWENTMQWLMPLENVLSPNHTEKMITCTKMINKKKAELIKKYQKEIDEGNIVVIENIEKELLAYAKEYLGDDPYMDILDSGAGGSFGNNFKNMYVMKGAVKNPDPNAAKKYDIVTSNFMDGIKAEEYATIAGSGTAGAYSRGKQTEIGGHWEKLFISAYQHIDLDPKGSDCGTKKYITVDFTEKNIKDYMYSYIIENNGSLTLLNSKNYKKYIGKKVKLRFSSMCKSTTGICNMCAGELLYVGVAKVGINMAQVPDTLKLRCMKGFHDSTIKTTKMDPMKAFYPFG